MSSFVPAAIANLTDDQALKLSKQPRYLEGWKALERERVCESFPYFVSGYGSVEEARGAIPLHPWPKQQEVIDAMCDHDRIVILKARQLGLSWLALHRAVWLAAFSREHQGARVLIACKNQEDASNQLRRARRIIERLPSWLRPALGADSATRIEFPDQGGSSIRVLTANPEAIRGETASLVIWDEAAFSKNQTAPAIWTALLPAVEQGQLLVISTGNGRTGDGAQFSELWDLAERGGSDLHPIFLPWSSHPGRTPEWAAKTAAAMGDDDAFRQEYPAEPEDAFRARSERAVYPGSHINAAVALATENPYEQVPGIEIGIDWGDVQTAAVYFQPLELEGGGIRIVGELVQSRVEPRRAALDIFQTGAQYWQSIVEVACDAAPAGTTRTAWEALENLHYQDPEKYPDELTAVPFSKFKEGGAEARGVNTVGYIRYLLANTYEAQRTGKVVGPRIAIDPELAPTLLAQMKALVRDERGRIAKPPLDTKRPERGDHVCDALVAGLASRALARWQADQEEAADEPLPTEPPESPWQ